MTVKFSCHKVLASDALPVTRNCIIKNTGTKYDDSIVIHSQPFKRVLDKNWLFETNTNMEVSNIKTPCTYCKQTPLGFRKDNPDGLIFCCFFNEN